MKLPHSHARLLLQIIAQAVTDVTDMVVWGTLANVLVSRLNLTAVPSSASNPAISDRPRTAAGPAMAPCATPEEWCCCRPWRGCEWAAAGVDGLNRTTDRRGYTASGITSQRRVMNDNQYSALAEQSVGLQLKEMFHLKHGILN